MNKPMQIAAVALAAGVVLGGTAAAAEVRTGGAHRDQGGQPAKAVKKPQGAKKAQAQKGGKRAAAPRAIAARPAPKQPVAAARRAAPAPAATRPASVAKATPRPAATVRAPEVHWSQLPPSRFYPNGIPELRPEFLHPLPGQQVVEAATGPRATPHGHPDQMP